jgi:hypothetical protein
MAVIILVLTSTPETFGRGVTAVTVGDGPALGTESWPPPPPPHPPAKAPRSNAMNHIKTLVQPSYLFICFPLHLWQKTIDEIN